MTFENVPPNTGFPSLEHLRQLVEITDKFKAPPRAYLVVDPQTYDYLNMRVLTEETWDLPDDKDKPFKFTPRFDYGIPIIRNPILTTGVVPEEEWPVPVEPWKPSAFLTADAPPKYTQEVVSDTWTGAVVLGVISLLILLLGAAV
jgi:hypothetical protein